MIDSYADIGRGWAEAGRPDRRAVASGLDVFQPPPSPGTQSGTAVKAGASPTMHLLAKAERYSEIAGQVSDPDTRRIYEDAARELRKQAKVTARQSAEAAGAGRREALVRAAVAKAFAAAGMAPAAQPGIVRKETAPSGTDHLIGRPFFMTTTTTEVAR